MDTQISSSTDTDLKRIVESILFTSASPVKAQVLCDLLAEKWQVSAEDIAALVATLNAEYRDSGRSFVIDEIAGGYVLNTLPEYSVWITRFHNKHVVEKLSASTFETLSIIAYKQPITRSEIEAIRGVNTGGILQHLSDKGLIRIAGRKEIPGRPFMYATTRKFLEYFRLKSIRDLPELGGSDLKLT